MKLSVIVPIYNSEQYLDACLRSIVEQVFTDFEVILVNDGSTDCSLQICERWKENDSRIKVINKKNGGVSSARNAGMHIAQGEYIGFVDSDDYVDPTMYRELVEAADSHSSDITICRRIIPNCKKNYGHDYPLERTFSFESEDVDWQRQYFRGNMESFVTNKIFKRSFLNKTNVAFKPIPFLEDSLFLQDLYVYKPVMFYIAKDLYIYRTVPGSAVRKYHANRFEIIQESFKKEKKIASEICGGLYVKEINEDMACAIVNCIKQEGLNWNKDSNLILQKIRGSWEFNDIYLALDELEISRQQKKVLNWLKLGDNIKIRVFYGLQKIKIILVNDVKHIAKR